MQASSPGLGSTAYTRTAADCAPLLFEALAPDRAAASRLAQAWCVPDEQAWSPVDVVVQNRRHFAGLGSQHGTEVVRLIDATVAHAWALALASQFRLVRPDRVSQEVRSLALLTLRIPSPDIHGGLFAALMDTGAQLSAMADATVRAATRKALARVLLPAWFQTLDRASRAQMRAVIRQSQLLTAEDYFAGWVWAWRFGIDRAVDHVDALAEALPSSLPRLPLASDDDCRYFAQLVAGSMPHMQDRGYLEMIEGMFEALRKSSALLDWSLWLGEVLAALPTAGWMLPAEDDAAREAPPPSLDDTDPLDELPATQQLFAPLDATTTVEAT